MENLQITEMTLTNFLRKELLYKPYQVGWENQILNIFLSFLENNGIDKNGFWLQNRGHSKQTVSITYDNKEIGYIEVKKERGNYNYRWRTNTYYDWTYKDFNVVFFSSNNLQAAAEKAKEELLILKNKKETLENESFEAYKKLFEKFGEKTHDIVDCMNRNNWKFYSKLKKN